MEKYLMMILKELISYLGPFEVSVTILKNHSAGFLRGKCAFLWETLPGMGLLLSYPSFYPQKGLNPFHL